MTVAVMSCMIIGNVIMIFSSEDDEDDDAYGFGLDDHW